jgi:hypothetical protein
VGRLDRGGEDGVRYPRKRDYRKKRIGASFVL